jgi:hypothetical protein
MPTEANRPGTAYFVPGVRISKLGPFQRGAAPAQAVELPSDVLADVLQVEVTRVNTVASQFSVTFNNWYTTTAADRAAPERLGAREIQGRSQPLWPRYKYNDFSLLAFGDRLRIDFSYWLDASNSTTQDWVPMVAGPITDMRFTFSASEGAQVVVSGEDDLSRLKDKPQDRVELGRHCERTLVLRALDSAKYPITELAPPRVTPPPFFADESRGVSESIQDGQSFLDFLQKIAERLYI